MRFRYRRLHVADPFRLSPLGRFWAALAWMRGPMFLRRWVFAVLVVGCLTYSGGVTIFSVMHAASPDKAAAIEARPGVGADRSRHGPASSQIIDLPGYECRPMPSSSLEYLNPMEMGPSVVAIDRRGVMWGPSCVVTNGLAGS